MPNAKDIIYSQDVLYIIKTNQSEYALEGMKSCYLASGNIIMVDVTNKLLDVRNGDSYGSKYEDSAILRQVYRYTGAQVSRGGGDLKSQFSGFLPQTWTKKVSPKGS